MIAISKVLRDDEKGFQKDVESMSRAEIEKMIREFSKKCGAAAAELNFEDAALYRDKDSRASGQFREKRIRQVQRRKCV